MIDRLCSRQEAAYYSIAYNMALVLNIVIASVHGAVQPWFFAHIRNGNISELRRKSTKLIGGVSALCILAMLLSPAALWILAPGSYGDALRVMPVICMASLFYGEYMLFSNVAASSEKPVYMSIATVIGAVANVGLNLLLIPKYGYVAAGYTTLFCYMLFAGMPYVFSGMIWRRQNGRERVFEGWKLLLISAGSFLVMLLYSLVQGFVG